MFFQGLRLRAGTRGLESGGPGDRCTRGQEPRAQDQDPWCLRCLKALTGNTRDYPRKFSILLVLPWLPTVVLRTKEASAVYRSKMAFFKRAWQKVKVMSRPWALGFKSETIRPLNWGTLGSRTPDGSKNTSRQSFIFFLPTFMACIFRTTGSSGTQCTSF